jgi:lipopolysaccharide transport system permease protein
MVLNMSESVARTPTGIDQGVGQTRGTQPALPEEPLVIIEPRRGWAKFDLRELWAHRELLYFLAWRDLKVRYKQAVLGVAWVVMQPLLMTLIFTVFLGMLARVPSGGLPYPLLVYTGLMPWTFFSGAVTGSGHSLVTNANLITKIYFPRVLVPAASIGARLMDFGISFIILGGMLIYYRVEPTRSLLMLPLLMVLTTLLAFGVGLLVAALNVKYRDVGVILPVLMQLWMFVSPVIYSSVLVPEKWRTLFALNPMVGIIDGFRASLFGSSFDWLAFGISAVITIALLLFAILIFGRLEKSFADII